MLYTGGWCCTWLFGTWAWGGSKTGFLMMGLEIFWESLLRWRRYWSLLLLLGLAAEDVLILVLLEGWQLLSILHNTLTHSVFCFLRCWASSYRREGYYFSLGASSIPIYFHCQASPRKRKFQKFKTCLSFLFRCFLYDPRKTRDPILLAHVCLSSLSSAY